MNKLNIGFLLLLSCLIFCCSNKYSRKEHRRTTALENNLYIETYTIYGSGAFGTDIVNQYLTDSSSFRVYIGSFDEGPEYYYYQVLGDTVHIEKYKSSEGKAPKELLEKSILIISEMNKKKIGR